MILTFLVFFPFLGGLFTWLIGKHNEKLRDYLADLITAAVFILTAVLFAKYGASAGEHAVRNSFVPEICGFGLNFTLDGFRLIYGMIAAFMWMMTTILSREYFAHHENRNRFYLFLLLTLGATMGVFLSADLYTTFIFFEIMSFTSYVWVAQEENPAALRAASTYLAVAVIGGLVMLMGIFLVYHELGTVQISEILHRAKECQKKGLLYAAGACMLFGFGAKAGAFPLHIWLPKAHPVAPAPASALLSGILTKTGIYGVLIISCNLFLHDKTWGILILTLGVLTMFGGALLAVFSIDLKRTLACSSMSQIGFIMVGIGMQGLLGEENALAVHGTMLHMMNHSMIKLVLFMAAGVIYMNTHALDLNQIRGFGRKKPLLKIIFLVGALTIGGIPMFGGYISKTLLHESIVEFGGGYIMKAAEWIFLFSGGLTVAYMTKLFVSIFIEKNESQVVQKKYDQKKDYMNAESTFALGGSAAVLLIWGLLPQKLMDGAASMSQNFMNLEEFGEEVHYFSMKNLSGACISIGIGAIVYLFVIRRFLMEEKKKGQKVYTDRWPKWLDLENLIYRPLLMQGIPYVLGLVCKLFDNMMDTVVRCVIPVCAVVCRIFDTVPDFLVVALRKSVYKDSPLPQELPEGNIFTTGLGTILNFLKKIGNHTWNRKHPVDKNFVHILAVRYAEIKENNLIIERSLSFALLLVCVGLMLTTVYILWW